MKRFLSIVNGLVMTLLVLVALLSLSSAFSVGGVRTFSVLSGSMEPTIHTGSVIVTVPASSYAVGDIVTRRTENASVTVTHRIAEASEKGETTMFRTKGDANDIADSETFPEADILGRVRFSIPWLGYVASFARTREGFLLLVIIPAVIVVYEELRKLKDEVVRLWRKRRERKTLSRVRIDDGPKPDRPVARPVSVPEGNIGEMQFGGREDVPRKKIV
ncbi:MAG: signal peptidase I [Candidatus Moranbacteria bacterium]|nr:signal peptidase I [Candidatus Moranbacteria bacterium]